MKILLIKIALLLIIMFSTSCQNLYSQVFKIVGPYFVAKDPAGDYKTLFYDLGNGNSIERVRNVKRVGHTRNFIIIEEQNGYYIINRKKDNKYLNGNEILGKRKTHDQILIFFKSNKIIDFHYDYFLEK